MIHADPHRIAIYLTDKCNLKCKHCFIEGSPENDKFLSWKQVETTLKYFIKHNTTGVEFTGGESCLSPSLIPAVKLAKKLGYVVGVNTNGITPGLLNILSPQMIDKITFSIDGANSKTHDFLRGKGMFNRLIKTMNAAIEKGYYTEAIFTVHRRNIKEIGQAIRLLDQMKVGRLSFNFISNQGAATMHQQLLLPPEAWIKAKKIIEAHSNTQHLNLRYPVLFVTEKEFQEIKTKLNYFCRLLDPVKTDIYPDGNIYHCCLVTDIDNLAAGKVTDTKVVMDSSKETAFAMKYKHLSCPAHQIKQLYSSTTKLIPLCLYYKEFTKSNSPTTPAKLAPSH